MRLNHMAAAIALTLAVTACRDAAAPTPQPDGLIGAPASGSGQYIVVFRDAVADPRGLARQLVQAHGGSLLFTYTSAIKGFAARLPAPAVRALALNPLVSYIEPDREYRADVTQTMDANGDPWGLDRIDQQALPLSGSYDYTASGEGVNAYIIDTGIWTLHPDFGGRADNVYDGVTLDLLGGATGEDCNGHGTHVAGTIGGATYGVAKGVSLHGVRVLNCSGVGFTSQIIAGIDWVRENAVRPAVANMSLGGGFSQAMNDATTSLWDAGIFVAVAAGNSNADACQASPASASGAFTVAASERTDAKAAYSNWGPCVEAYAPGSAIKSDYLLGLTQTLSGTSMASPHVAGVAALYKSAFGDVPSADLADAIIANATADAITGNPDGTPNRLLNKGSL
ncbi:MAG TPA: S8 family peptidase [Gemmatimonadales bacterium]|jgi:subtilisin family serine protease|nr:S8 family peptidase [Gemmatimonadales bacterium]